MNIKTIPLYSWMKNSWALEDVLKYGSYKQLPTVFNRPGVYKIGKVCWFETTDGKAFYYDREQFDYDMSLINVSEYNARQVNALGVACREKVATKTQQRLYHLCVEVGRLHEMQRKGHFSMQKRLREFLKTHPIKDNHE